MARPRVLSLILVNSGVCSLFPHIFLWGSSFWFCIPPPRPPPPPPPPAPPLTHCHTPSFTHNFVTHHLSHTTLSHTIFHTQSLTHTHTIFHTHTPSFTHHLSHTISLTHTPSFAHHLSDTISHTHCHTPSFTYSFVTHHLSHFHTPSFTHILTLSHTIFHTQLCYPPSFTHIFANYRHMAARQAGHPPSFHRPSIFGRRGRRGIWWHPPSFCVADVALVALGGALGPGLVWRRGTLRGRHGTWRRAPSFCVAGVAFGDIHPRFAWQTWHLLHLVARLGRDWSDAAVLCVAGMALGDAHLRFVWQASHLVTCTFVLRGRRGTCCTWWRAWARLGALGPGLVAGDAAVLCVAGMALGDAHLRFVWQVSHLVTSTFVLHGKRGMWWHAPSFCVAGVALVALGGALGPGLVWRRGTLRGRGGTWRHAPSFCKAGMALGEIHLRFAWQARQLVTSTFTPSFSHHLTHTTWSETFRDHLSHTFHTPLCYPPSFTTPSYSHICHTTLPHTTLSMSVRGCKTGRASTFVSQAWHLVTSIFGRRGRSCMWWHPPSFCVVGVAFGDIHLRCPVARIPPPPPHHLSHTTLSHTIFHHTIFSTQLSHTPSFATPCFTHRFVTPSFTQLCHTLSFTHNFHTHTHHLSHTTLSHTIFHTQLCHTHTHRFSLSHTIFHIPLCHTQLFTYNLFYFSILHHILCLSFLPRPHYNICGSCWKKVDLWGFPVLYNFWFSTNFAPGLLQVELPSSNSMQPYSKSRGDQQFNRSI